MSIEDRAQEHEAKLWEYHNRPREVSSFKPEDPGYGPEECEECGAEMHAVRRTYGFKMCTPCASARERRR